MILRCNQNTPGQYRGCWFVALLLATHKSGWPVISARKKSGLSQSEFAKLLGVFVRTLQEWEQGRRQASGAAKILIGIAEPRPRGAKRSCSLIANDRKLVDAVGLKPLPILPVRDKISPSDRK